MWNRPLTQALHITTRVAYTAAGQGAGPRIFHLRETAADGDEGFDAAVGVGHICSS